MSGPFSEASDASGTSDNVFGAPDGNAWQPDAAAQVDFITLDFGSVGSVSGILLRESGGGLAGIEASSDGINFAPIWSGADPTGASDLQDFVVHLPAALTIEQFRIHFASGVSASNALDAVGLLTDSASPGLVVRGFDSASGDFVVSAYNSASQPTLVDAYFREQHRTNVTNAYSTSSGLLSSTTTTTYTTGTTLAAQIVVQGFNAAGQVVEETDGTGTLASAIVNGYDSQGRQTSLANTTDGTTTSWDYSNPGAIVETTSMLVDGSSTPETVTFTQTFNSLGQLATAIDADGHKVVYSYYDDGTEHTESWYNAATDTTAANVKTFTYDDAGNLLTAGDSSGTYSYTYNAAGQLIQVVEPTEVLVNSTLTPFILQFGYDSAGNRNLVKDNLDDKEQSYYDAYGELVRRTEKQGTTFLGRLDQTFNAAGQLVEQRRYSDEAGTTLVAVTEYAYDSWTGQQTSIVTNDGSASPLAEFDYAYDLAGEVASASSKQAGLDSSLVTTDYAYDSSGQLTTDGDASYAYAGTNRSTKTVGSVTTSYTTSHDQLTKDGTWNYTYDAAGNTIGKSAINGLDVWGYTYNAQNQLVKVEEKSDGVYVSLRVEYTYDVYGNRISTTTNTSGDTHPYEAPVDTTEHVNGVADSGADHVTVKFATAINVDDLTIDEYYDAPYVTEVDLIDVDNVSHAVFTGLGLTATGTHEYKITLGSETSYLVKEVEVKYDTDYGSYLWEYDLTDVVLHGNTPAVVAATADPVTVHYVLDGWNPAKSSPVGNENYDVWADINADGSLATRYVMGDQVDQILARIDVTAPSDSTTGVKWYLTDQQGSLRTLLDASGSEIISLRYDAFGNVADTDVPNTMGDPLLMTNVAGRYQWTGREVDAETGLQYNRARWYDSSTGRWSSQDPMGFDAGDSNLYRYAKNNPTNGDDPSGLRTEVNWPALGIKLGANNHNDTITGQGEMLASYPTNNIIGGKADGILLQFKTTARPTAKIRFIQFETTNAYYVPKKGSTTVLSGTIVEPKSDKDFLRAGITYNGDHPVYTVDSHQPSGAYDADDEAKLVGGVGGYSGNVSWIYDIPSVTSAILPLIFDANIKEIKAASKAGGGGRTVVVETFVDYIVLQTDAKAFQAFGRITWHSESSTGAAGNVFDSIEDTVIPPGTFQNPTVGWNAGFNVEVPSDGLFSRLQDVYNKYLKASGDPSFTLTAKGYIK